MTWTPLTALGKRDWTSAASSADGSVLAVAVNNGAIYTSANGGVTWTEQVGAGTQPWRALAMSSDGAKIASGASYGYIYTFDAFQAEDGWVRHDDILGSRAWRGLAASYNGSILWAATPGSILKSVDSGNTWTAVDSAGYIDWSRIACSSDGSRVVASQEHSALYFTSNNVSTELWPLFLGSRLINLSLFLGDREPLGQPYQSLALGLHWRARVTAARLWRQIRITISSEARTWVQRGPRWARRDTGTGEEWPPARTE